MVKISQQFWVDLIQMAYYLTDSYAISPLAFLLKLKYYQDTISVEYIDAGNDTSYIGTCRIQFPLKQVQTCLHCFMALCFR